MHKKTQSEIGVSLKNLYYFKETTFPPHSACLHVYACVRCVVLCDFHEQDEFRKLITKSIAAQKVYFIFLYEFRGLHQEVTYDYDYYYCSDHSCHIRLVRSSLMIQRYLMPHLPNEVHML